jgi:hypothetical protein
MVSGESLLRNEGKSQFNWKTFRVKVLASSAAMIFGAAVLLMSVLAISNPAVVHPNTEPVTLIMDTAASSASLAKMEYYLPYPGILPDSPLYKIKALRDRVELWLTFNPTDKASKELQFADKRINAAIFLMQGGKANLAVSTATKAEKYLESAVNLALDETKKGKDMKSLLGEMDKSANKHLEVLNDLAAKVGGEDLKALQSAMGTTQATDDKIKQTVLEK